VRLLGLKPSEIVLPEILVDSEFLLTVWQLPSGYFGLPLEAIPLTETHLDLLHGSKPSDYGLPFQASVVYHDGCSLRTRGVLVESE